MSHHHNNVGDFIGITLILSWIAGLGIWIFAYVTYRGQGTTKK